MEQPASFYDKIYSTSKRYRLSAENCVYYPMWEVVLSWLHDHKVIELGCGSGQFGGICLADGIDYHGIDFSKEAIKIANGTWNGYFEVGDALTADLTDCTAVVMLELLEHIDRDLECVGRIPEGIMTIISVPQTGISKAHVREFRSLDDVLNRYRPLINIDCYSAMRLPPDDPKGGIWYLIKGARLL